MEDKQNFKIDLANFKAQLMASWDEVVIHKSLHLNNTDALEWKFKVGKDILWGYLHEDLSTLALDTFSEGIAKFAIWYRAFIPPNYRLFLSHDSVSEEIELAPELNEAQLLLTLNKHDM